MTENSIGMQNARRMEAEQSLNRAADCYWGMQNINTIAFRRVPGQSEEVFEQRKAFLMIAQQMLNNEFHTLMDQACNAWRVYRKAQKEAE